MAKRKKNSRILVLGPTDVGVRISPSGSVVVHGPKNGTSLWATFFRWVFEGGEQGEATRAELFDAMKSDLRTRAAMSMPRSPAPEAHPEPEQTGADAPVVKSESLVE